MYFFEISRVHLLVAESVLISLYNNVLISAPSILGNVQPIKMRHARWIYFQMDR